MPYNKSIKKVGIRYGTGIFQNRILLGSSALERLAASRVAVFGIGGVGGYVCEALARTGVGHLDLIDSDTVAVSNINRQIIATTKTVGQYKTDAWRLES